MPRVSVITIFLDAEPFIGEAIESVLQQTYDDWELLLVDDGSSDGSTAIAQRYAQMRPDRIRYFEHPEHENRGMSASRNLGLTHASAEYIGFLDADDAWLRTKLEEQVAILDAYPEVAMVFGTEIVWYSWSGRPEDLKRDHPWQPVGLAMDSVAQPDKLLPLLLRYGRAPCPSLVLVRRDAARSVGGFEPEFRDLYEDDVFYSKVWLSFPAFVSSKLWSRRRQHGAASTSRQGGERQRAARRTYLEWLERYLTSHTTPDAAVWSALREQLETFASSGASPSRRGARLLGRGRARLASVGRRCLAGMTQRSSGNLRAEPNPVHLGLTHIASTTLSWSAVRTNAVEVRLGSPDGPLVSRGGATGRTATGDWLTNGMVFYLQDVSGDKPLTERNTLDAVRIALLP